MTLRCSVNCLSHVVIRFRAPIEPALFLVVAALQKDAFATRLAHPHSIGSTK